MMTLNEAQSKFTYFTAKLIEHAYAAGYALTYGETYRTPAQAARNAASGSGISNSLHCRRLAVDFQLFKDGEYLTDKASYAFLGTYWKSLDPHCFWGGDFKHLVDSDHFSYNPFNDGIE